MTKQWNFKKVMTSTKIWCHHIGCCCKHCISLLTKKSTWRDVVFQKHGLRRISCCFFVIHEKIRFHAVFKSHQITIEGLPSFSRKHDRARPISDPPKQCFVEPLPNLTMFLFIWKKTFLKKKDPHLWHFFCKPDVIGGPHVGQSSHILWLPPCCGPLSWSS